MSWFGFTSPSGGRCNRQGVFDRIFSRPRTKSRKRDSDLRNGRSLRIDPLEERCLLSVTPATLSAIIVNQTYGSAQDTNAAHSVASDNSGDFVVTWTRSDPVLNAAGNPIINSATGEPYQVENVLARYFTDTEEQITLPAGTSRFSLTDNDQTIDEISITAGTAPNGDTTAPAVDMVGTFTLWFDTNGDGIATQNELKDFQYSETDPSATATAIQTWLNGFTPDKGVSDATHATVNAIDPDTFVVDFGTATEGLNQSSLLQYVGPSNTSMLASTVTNEPVFNFTAGYLPSIAVTTLDHPFTINNIPVSPTNPDLTAEAIASYFEPPSAAGATAVAPVDMPEPTEARTTTDTLAPYTEPVATTSQINTTPTTFVTAQPVAGANGALSTTSFDITFTGYVDGGAGNTGEAESTSGATVDAAMVVTNCVNASGTSLSSTTVGTEGVPTGSTGSSVTILKESGNEFQVNPPQPNSIYAQNTQALNSDQPAVAMDGSGDFVVTWREQVAQEVAPKNVTDVYFRRYSPVGVTDSYSDAVVPGAVTSDLDQDQLLTFDFTAAVPTSNTDTFVLQVGSVTTSPILFNINPSATAAAIQAGLVDAGFTGTSVSAVSSGNPFQFDVTFGNDSAIASTIQYVAAASTLPTTLTVTAVSTQGFTGVRLLANPTQQLTFDSTATEAFSGTFQLQVGSQETPAGAITFDSGDLAGTAASIQAALVSLGYSGATVSVVSSTSTSVYTFDVTFEGAATDANLPAISVINATDTLPATVTFVPITDPYTEQANINYTNPQYDPAVAMDAYGNFVVVWANQGQDLSWFNNISMERFDTNGNPVAYVGSVNNGSLTDLDFAPDVAIGYDGNVVVTWSETADPEYLVNQSGFSTVYVRAFNPQSVPLWNEMAVSDPNGGFSTVSMDGQDNFVVTWDVAADPDVGTAVASEGIYAAEYQLENYGLPGTTFTNSALTSAKSQTLTFTSQNVPLTGTFELQVGSVTTAAITFNSANLAATATNMQNALVTAGIAGVKVAVGASTSNSFSFTVTFTTAEPPVQYIADGDLLPPKVLRNTFRVNSASTNLASQTVWPFDQTAADVQMDIDGDIVTSYQGNGSAVSTDTISIPADFFQSYFALEEQQLTFTTSVAASGGSFGSFKLQVGPTGTPTTAIPLSTSPAVTALAIQNALVKLGFAGTTVSGTSAAGNTTFVFVVTFGLGSYEPTIQVTAGTLPTGVTFAATITQQPLNQDLLQYFDPFPNANPLGDQGQNGNDQPLGLNGADSGYDNENLLLYQDFLGAIATVGAGGYNANGTPTSVVGEPNADLNFNVDTTIDQVLYDAQYVEGASTEQVGRLRDILENVAGLLRGEADGVLMTQVDANPTDSSPTATTPSPSVATYSDDAVSTQRSGQNQSYYITIPSDVQSGSFELQITVGGSTTDVPDVQGYTDTTGVIQMPSTVLGNPGGVINAQQTMENIAVAIDTVLGTIYPNDGSVNIREVGSDAAGDPVGTTEIDARQGTSYQLPANTTNAELPTVALPAGETAIGGHGWFIFELVFQGQAHDVPITLAVTDPNDLQWVKQKHQAGGTPPPAPTYAFAQVSASPPVATDGDYDGVQGSPQYDASIAMTSAGSMVSAYTSEPVLTDDNPLPSDSNVSLNGDDTVNPTSGFDDVQNIYAEPLEETTDTAGPHIVGFTDANGINLLGNLQANVTNGNILTGGVINAKAATGVTATYFVLTFDEPMLSDNPAVDSDSVFDAANYQIYNSAGTLMSGVVTQVNYGLSEVAQMAETPGFSTNPNSAIPDNKWEVVLTIDDTANAANGGALPDGTYELVVRNAVPATAASAGQTGLCNIYGTPMQLTGFDPTGSDFKDSITISSSANPGGSPVAPGLTATDNPINSTRGGQQIDPAVATGPSGNYVVVWTSVINGQSNIVGQLYNASGTALGAEFTVNTAGYTSCGRPDVGMDGDGNFVVTWSGVGPNSNSTTEPSDIFARQYNAEAQATNNPFQVDQWIPGVQAVGVQSQSSVAVSPNGTFIVTWTSSPVSTSNTNTGNAAIFAREYSPLGVPLGNNGNEIQISASSSSAQSLSDVAIDSNDDFVIVWEGDIQSATWGVYGAYFTNTGTTTAPVWSEAGPMLLNKTPNTRGSFTEISTLDLHDTGPRVDMVPATADTSANFVVTWANYSSSTSTGYNVYAQIFHTNLSAVDSAFMVDEIAAQPSTQGWQLMPAVGVDGEGHITIVWTSYGQDNAEIGDPNILDYGVYARMYNADGSNYYDPSLGAYPMEFRINATTLGDQVAPAVASNNPNDDAIVAWVGPDTKAAGTTAIYLRVVDPPPTGATVTPVQVKHAPLVSTNPSSQKVNASQSVTFTVAA